jgi:hypothetical protein
MASFGLIASTAPRGSDAILTHLRPFLTAVTMQLVGITVTFAIIDRLQRRAKQRWYFPPTYLSPVPRWQSMSGIVVWTVVLGWWAAIPLTWPLVPGRAAADLVLAPGWYVVYWAVLLLMVAGIVQRGINLVRPDWNWLPPAARLAINVLALALLVVMASRSPYVAVADPDAAAPGVVQLARGLNGVIRWALVGVSPFYLVFNVGLHAWFCAQHIGDRLRRRCGRHYSS